MKKKASKKINKEERKKPNKKKTIIIQTMIKTPPNKLYRSRDRGGGNCLTRYKKKL